LLLVSAAAGVSCDRAPPVPLDGESPLPEVIEQSMVLVPAGPFTMGSNRVDTENKWREYGYTQPWYVDEHPQHTVSLPAFQIDRYEVSNAAYLRFTLDTQRANRRRLLELIAQQDPIWPSQAVANVSWQFARDYCAWAGKRLPSEAEWEKAARGGDGREFPWGDAWDAARVNAGGEDWPGGVAPITAHPEGASPYGALNMAGNVAEWVEDWYAPYPGAEFNSAAYGQTHRVVRGGGWGGVGHYALSHFYRGAYRDYEMPERAFNDIGFRCARDVRTDR
jgi:formylglycine-generating enzyme required for sulfatase activity